MTREAVVVDTNVLVVAEDPRHEAGPECVAACVEELTRTLRERWLLLDGTWLILGEYRKQMEKQGQGGLGTEFFRRAAAQTEVQVHQVHITPHSGRVFSEFPPDPELVTFDRSDRKFVAVAIASGEGPAILHATDRGWRRHREALTRHALRVTPICDPGGRQPAA